MYDKKIVEITVEKRLKGVFQSRLPFLALFALAVLVSPYVVRYIHGDVLLFGDEPYYHARIAGQLVRGELSAADTLVYNERPYFFGPYHVVLAAVSVMFGFEAASAVLPVVFGLVSFILFYIILGRFGIDGFRRLIISVILIMSPAFIGTFSKSNPHSLAILLYMIGIYLIVHKGRPEGLVVSPATIAGFLVLVSTLMFGFFNFLLLLVLLIGIYSVDEKRKLFFLVLFSLSFVSAAAYYLFFSVRVVPASLLSVFISDFGGIGFGIFTLILLLAGLAFSWKSRYIYSLPYYLLLYLMASLFFEESSAIPYLGFVIAVFAGEGFYRIANLDWELSLVKRFTILLIVCGLLFSTSSYLGRLSGSGPDSEIVKSLAFLKEQEQGLVFSHYSNGFWIEFFAGKPVILDSFIVPGLEKRYSDSMDLFYSRNIDSTRRLLDKYNVYYIFVDESMRKGKVWSKNDEGLLFLLGSNETFTKIYNSSDVQIWRYK